MFELKTDLLTIFRLKFLVNRSTDCFWCVESCKITRLHPQGMWRRRLDSRCKMEDKTENVGNTHRFFGTFWWFLLFLVSFWTHFESSLPSAPHPDRGKGGCGAEGREDSKCVQKLTKNNKNHQKVPKNLQKQQKSLKSAKKSSKKSACELVRGKPTNFYEILCKL